MSAFVILRGAVWPAAAVIMVLIAAEDIKTMKISDRYNVILLALAAASAVFECAAAGPEASGVASEILRRAEGAASVSVPMVLFNRCFSHGFGGGDIFLCISAGALIGPGSMLRAAAMALTAAGIFAGCGLLTGKMKPDSRFPLGPFLCGGIIFVLLG